MKYVNKLISTALLSLVFASMVGCNSAPKKETTAEYIDATAEYIDDSYLTTKVKAAILRDPTLKSSEINVETYKGAVQLSGFVNSRSDINRAVEVTRTVRGVKAVRNDMQLKNDISSSK